METEVILLLKDYGILGLWTATLLWERYKTQANTKQVIKNNTEALTKVYEVITKCKR